MYQELIFKKYLNSFHLIRSLISFKSLEDPYTSWTTIDIYNYFFLLILIINTFKDSDSMEQKII